MTALLLGWFALVGRPRPAHRSRRPRAGARGAGPARAVDDAGSATSSWPSRVAVFLWVAPGLAAIVGQDGSRAMQAFATSVPEAIAALIGAVLLFLLPIDWRQRRFTLTWEQAARHRLGHHPALRRRAGAGRSRVRDRSRRAGSASALTSVLPSHTELALTIAFAAAAILLSEATSNAASANMIVPVAIAVAQASGIEPLRPALAATLGASMGFMMPISTAPNAIVYSSGYVPIGAMMRHGLLLDLVASS